MILPNNNNNNNNIGSSFSPGGLLLPYHMGVADCLIQKKYLNPFESIVGGSSAGSIAAMAIGCGLDGIKGLEGTISISDNCISQNKNARGNLLPLLKEQMKLLVGDTEYDFLKLRQQNYIDKTTNGNNNNNGNGNGNDSDIDIDIDYGTGVCIAYKEIFPLRKSHFQTKFNNRNDFFNTVGYSCMFPFFTTNYPFIIENNMNMNNNMNNENINDNLNNDANNDASNNDSTKSRLQLPRFLMDGYFSLPREQFGCPIFEKDVFRNNNADNADNVVVDRTVAITCIPQELFGMDAVFNNNNNNNKGKGKGEGEEGTSNNLISISTDDKFTVADIFRIATETSSRKELTDLYERGYRDGEKWCRTEEQQQKQQKIENNLLIL